MAFEVRIGVYLPNGNRCELMTHESYLHEWSYAHNQTKPPVAYTCNGCTGTTTGCTECAHPIESNLTTCDRCLNKAKRVVQDVIDALATIPFQHAEIMGLRAVRYDRDVITGGGDRDRLPFGLDLITEDPEDTRIDAAKHPDTAIDTLAGWAEAWADIRNEHPGDPLTYLVDHTLWALQNQDDSAWAVYIVEARQVRKTIRRLLGINPEPEAAPCVSCGGTVIREWLPDGLDDVRRCTKCTSTWPDEYRLALANRATIIGLPDTHADTLVTIDEAKLALPHARRGTLDTWARRGREKPDTAKFPTQGTNVRGQSLYRLGDIRDAWENREQKTA